MKVSRTDTALKGLNHVGIEKLAVFRVASDRSDAVTRSAFM